jgi:putative oxidoreductase
MQRLYSMFPAGWPGCALLALRLSVAIALALEIHARRHDLSGWVLGTVIVLVVALGTGSLTPLAATLALGAHAWIWWRLGIGSLQSGSTICLDALALAVLGPGAYSVDAYRYGRRVVVLPPP